MFSRCVVSEPSPSEIQTPLPALTLAMSCFYSFSHTLSVGFSSSLWPWTCLALLSSLLPSGACTLTIAASPFTLAVGSRAYLPLPIGHSLWKGLPCTLHPETSVGAPSGCTPDTVPTLNSTDYLGHLAVTGFSPLVSEPSEDRDGLWCSWLHLQHWPSVWLLVDAQEIFVEWRICLQIWAFHLYFSLRFLVI